MTEHATPETAVETPDDNVGAAHPTEPSGYLASGGGQRRSLRDRFAALAPYRKETVPVEGVGDVEVRSLTLGDRNRALTSISDEDGNADKELIIAALIIASSFDPETGEKVFHDSDIEFIQGQDAGRMDELGKSAMKLNKMIPGTDQEIEEAEKA